MISIEGEFNCPYFSTSLKNDNPNVAPNCSDTFKILDSFFKNKTMIVTPFGLLYILHY